jgi:hypothetical protein
MTQVKQQQQKALTLKQQVCQLLQWADEDFAAFQYEMGLAYLKEYIPNDPHGADQLSRSKTFWNWWKNQWAQRDEKFIAMHRPNWKYEDTLYIYLDEHNPAILIGTTHPNAVVLHQSYAEMMQLIIDEINVKA